MPSDIAGALAFHVAAMKRVLAVITSDDVMGGERTSGTILDALYDASRTPMQPHNTYFSKLFLSVWRCWLSHLSAWVAHGSLLASSDGDFFVRDNWRGKQYGIQSPHGEWNSRFSVFWGAVPRLLLSSKQASTVLEMGLASRVLGSEGGDPLLATLAKRAAANSAGGGEKGQTAPPTDADVHLSSATRGRIATVFRALGTQPSWDALSFSVALDKVANVLQRYLWATLLFKSSLPSHLAALQNYALLGRGELFGQFLELAAPLLKSASDAYARLPAGSAAPAPPAALLAAHGGMAVLGALERHLQAGPWAAAGVATACDTDPHFARVGWSLVPPCLDCVLDLRCAGFSARAVSAALGERGGDEWREGGAAQATAPSKALQTALQRHPRVLQWLHLAGPHATGGPTGVLLGSPDQPPSKQPTSAGSCAWLAAPVSCEEGFIASAVAQLGSCHQAHPPPAAGGGAPDTVLWLHLALHSDARQWETPPPMAPEVRFDGEVPPPTPPCAAFLTLSVGIMRSALQAQSSTSAPSHIPVHVRVECGPSAVGGGRTLMSDTVAAPRAILHGSSIHVQIEYKSAALGRAECLGVSLLPLSAAGSPVELCATPCDLQQTLRPVGLRSLATLGVLHQDASSYVNVQRLCWESTAAVTAQGSNTANAAIGWLHMVRILTHRRPLRHATLVLYSQTYELPWPLHLAVPPTALANYSALCTFMLSVSHAGSQLHRAWVHLKQTRSLDAHFAVSASQRRGMHAAALLVSRFLHVVHTMQYHLLSDTASSMAAQLHTGVQEATSLRELQIAHARYIVGLLERSILASPAASRAVQQTVRLAGQASSFLLSLQMPQLPHGEIRRMAMRGPQGADAALNPPPASRRPGQAIAPVVRASRPSAPVPSGTLPHELGTETGELRIQKLDAAFRREVSFLFRLEFAAASRAAGAVPAGVGGGSGGSGGVHLGTGGRHDAHAGLVLRLDSNGFFASSQSRTPLL